MKIKKQGLNVRWWLPLEILTVMATDVNYCHLSPRNLAFNYFQTNWRGVSGCCQEMLHMILEWGHKNNMNCELKEITMDDNNNNNNKNRIEMNEMSKKMDIKKMENWQTITNCMPLTINSCLVSQMNDNYWKYNNLNYSIKKLQWLMDYHMSKITQKEQSQIMTHMFDYLIQMWQFKSYEMSLTNVTDVLKLHNHGILFFFFFFACFLVFVPK